LARFKVHDVLSNGSALVLTHISSGIQLAEKNVPIDLMFQSIAGTQLANEK
jgi:ethanolamine ammonia-lyase large subunit